MRHQDQRHRRHDEGADDREPARIREPLIVPAALDPDAVKILKRLLRHGHEAYLVGGCVRDLSLGHIPKDFDVATSARPRQIKRLFKNSRIIGRRFKLVHIQFGDKIIEVSTFRRTPNEAESAAGGERDDRRERFPDDEGGAGGAARRRRGADEEDGRFDGEEEIDDRHELDAHGEWDGDRDEYDDREEYDDGETDDDQDRFAAGDRLAAGAGDVDPGADAFDDRGDFPGGPAAEEGDDFAGAARRGRARAEPESDEDEEDEGRLRKRGNRRGARGREADRGGERVDDLLIRRDNVFGTAEEDALRRDFTINALFYDIEADEVIDYVGGTDDLERRAIRTIGDPRVRFQEDPVRILRAIRFAARLDFDIEPETHDAMVEFHDDLRRCAAPRVSEELLRLMCCGNARRAFELMDRCGALDAVLPELAAYLDRNPLVNDFEGHVWEQLMLHLGALDDYDHGRRVVANATLFALLLRGPILERQADERPGSDPGRSADDVIRPFTARMAVSRRDAFRVKQILVVQERLVAGQAPPRRRRGRGRRSDLLGRDYFRDALEFFRIESRALDRNQDVAEEWARQYYAFLRVRDPRAFRRAVQEAPFGEAPPPVDQGDDPGRGRRAAGRGAGDDEGDAAGRQDDGGYAEGDAEGDAETEDAGEARRDGDGEESGGSRRRRRRRRGRKDSAAGAAAGEGGGGDDSRPDGRSRAGRQRPQTSAASGGQRLEFDEVRAGPLRIDEAPAAEADEALERAEVRWDDPLPTVGDPGPISVIRTGIDQTERRGTRKRKKRKQDPASRELSKEVRHQPSLQALKMMGGDPRGHEVSRPRKARRAERERAHQLRELEKERPFDPLNDFESIEELFHW